MPPKLDPSQIVEVYVRVTGSDTSFLMTDLASQDFLRRCGHRKLLSPYSQGSNFLYGSAAQEWVAFLREMALSFTTNPALTEYQSLVSTDPEVEFFYNIVHLQVHRRGKAMTKFRTLGEDD